MEFTTFTISTLLNWQLSKNYKFICFNKKTLNPLYRKAKEEIKLLSTIEMKRLNIKFSKKKVYVDIMVTKERNMGDSHNLIEGILDALKECIGVDDRFYTVSCDWEINRSKDAEIRIKVSQEC